MSKKKSIYHVIIAGGVGERLWPLSSPKHPKQLLKIINDQTLIENTYNRIRLMADPDNILLVAKKELCAKISKILKELPEENFIIEPSAKNTAPAIGLAAVNIYQKNPKAIMCIYPADHFVDDDKKFKKTVMKAKKFLSKNDSLVTFGVLPSHPSVSYGYIQYNSHPSADDNTDCFRVITFAEKPTRNVAERFFSSGEFLWNAGIFVWKVKKILNEIDTYMPELGMSLKNIYNDMGHECYQKTLNNEWKTIKPKSIDYGILENTDNIHVIKSDFTWSDIGTWKSIFDIYKKDRCGNAAMGKVFFHDSNNNLVISDGRIAVVGIKNMAVIKNGDDIMIAPLNDDKAIREIINKMK